MPQFVYVCEDEANRDGGVEIPAEEDGTLLLSVLQSQFEGASGLKYRNPTSGCWRAVKRLEGVLQSPENGWGEGVYVVVITPPVTNSTPTITGTDGNKRKMEDLGETEERAAKNPRSSSPDFSSLKVGDGRGELPQVGDRREELPQVGDGRGELPQVGDGRGELPQVGDGREELPLVGDGRGELPQVRDLNREDLIVLGLEWSINDAELRRYFEQFGEVAEAEVKKEHDSGKSRGFGFVRFFDMSIQHKVQGMQHTIKGRRIDLKHPRKSFFSVQSPSYLPCKLFIGCLPIEPEATKEELQDYFSEYGEVSDVYIPKPYRGFGFVTFQDGNVSQRVLAQTHRLRHSTLNITHADPKGAVRGSFPPPSGSQYGYGYGSQFYNPQTAQGFYYGYSAPQPAQYNFTQRFPQQANFPRGSAPQAPATAQQSRVDQYQTTDAPPPPPAKRPHQGSQTYLPDPTPEPHYQTYGGGGADGGYGGSGYGNGSGRYRETGGGWQPQQ